MSRLLRNPDDISNHIDRLLDGIGARGSSFRDADRLTIVHNGGKPARFLFQELKWREEWDNQTPGQMNSLGWMLRDLAQITPFTVVVTIVEPDWNLTVRDYRFATERTYTPDEYREWFRGWWYPKAQGPAA